MQIVKGDGVFDVSHSCAGSDSPGMYMLEPDWRRVDADAVR
jgi:hypothetical protein